MCPEVRPGDGNNLDSNVELPEGRSNTTFLSMDFMASCLYAKLSLTLGSIALAQNDIKSAESCQYADLRGERYEIRPLPVVGRAQLDFFSPIA